MDLLDTVTTRVQELIEQGVKPGTAISTVAGDLNLTVGSVRGRWYRSSASDDGLHGNSKLSEKQDQTLTLLVLSFSAAQIPLDGKLLRSTVEILWGIRPSRAWPATWLQKHSDVINYRRSN